MWSLAHVLNSHVYSAWAHTCVRSTPTVHVHLWPSAQIRLYVHVCQHLQTRIGTHTTCRVYTQWHAGWTCPHLCACTQLYRPTCIPIAMLPECLAVDIVGNRTLGASWTPPMQSLQKGQWAAEVPPSSGSQVSFSMPGPIARADPSSGWGESTAVC